ncbi:Trp biosynthesis-associated membrane protein [Pseudonocardia kunmingensis]|uniref:Putative secreted protein n=1 Tax=Pseudonocardia kunmingensis TaxID=630975 RepID=A0A543DXE4_9PSEU|nr:Trp biosynthesis-associated membrane protein [Pseudonocardia kunmingensis]TQM14007.1 putative secreted protein [Pseudonocardia kunmingensis]
MTARPRPRALVTACAGLALAAGLLWIGGTAVWYRVPSATGAPDSVTGAQVAPWLGGVALLALAGIAGLVASGGVLRRVVGVVLALAGAGVLAFALTALFADPGATDVPASALPQSPHGESVDDLRRQTAQGTPAPLLPAAGGLLLLGVGALVAVRERSLPRLGARYAAPGERRVVQDPDRAAWQALDAGQDPTTDPPDGRPEDRGDDPGDGPRNAAV